MKDFFNQDLQIGDSVVFNAPNYRAFIRGKIISVAKSGISCMIEYRNTWNYGKEGKMETCRQWSNQVVKDLQQNP